MSLLLRLGGEGVDRNLKNYERIIPAKSYWHPSTDWDLQEILRFIKKVDMANTALVHLKVSLHIYQWEDDSKDRDYSDSEDSHYGQDSEYQILSGYDTVSGYEVDLSFLLAFGTQFNHVEFEFTPTFLRTNDSDHVEGDVVVVPMVQRELARVAKLMVGGEAWLLKDWIEQTGTPEEGNPGHWCLDVKRSSERQREGTLAHTGLRNWPGTDDDNEDVYVLQEDKGDGMQRWRGAKHGEVVEVQLPVIKEEVPMGPHAFQRCSISIERSD